MDKFQELQEKLVDAARKANQSQIEELKAELAEVKKNASRFQVAEMPKLSRNQGSC